MQFAERYAEIYEELLVYPVAIESRMMPIAYEIVNDVFFFNVFSRNVSVFSQPGHRVVPIKFVLAELCHLLAGRNDIESLASYNTVIRKYDDGLGYMAGAYGYRLRHQLIEMVARMKRDMYTRQACATIWEEADGAPTTRVNIPCNVFLQLLYRNETLVLCVVSRSSDYVTGFSIDSLHWQMLVILMANELQEHGMNIQRITIEYVIGSLHIYTRDMPVLEKWKLEEGAYEHFINVPVMTLTEAIQRAKAQFRGGLTLVELGNILCLDTPSMQTVVQLDEMFRTHKNVLVR